MLRRDLNAQRDFSAGELDPNIKRGDDLPTMKAGARQMSNWRIRSSRGISNRPGRRAIFLHTGRVDEVLILPGTVAKLCFGNDGSLDIRDSTDAVVASQPASTYPWTTLTVRNIVWCAVPRDVLDTDIVICFPGMQPKIVRYSVNTGWTFLDFFYSITPNGFYNAPFIRFAPPGVTLTPDAAAPTLMTASAGYFSADMVGHVIRFFGQQITLTSFVSSTVMGVTPINNLTLSESTTVSGAVGSFSIGDIVIGSVTGYKGEVGAIVLTAGVPTGLTITHEAPGEVFDASEVLVGPNGRATNTSGATGVTPPASVQWDEMAFDQFRGWPESCFFDQNRLGFCNIPSVPSGIAYSAVNDYTNFLVGAQPANSIFELVPGKNQVLFVVPGMESSEFVFCDRSIFYIPITPSNPLVPGSVAFQLLSSDGIANVQPRTVQEFVLYINAGQTNVMAVVAIGAYNRPYETRNLSELHSHLFRMPQAIAVPTSTAQFEERYVYVLNSDNTLVVGKYDIEARQVKGSVGWVPWNGTVSAVFWISALNATVTMSSIYAPQGGLIANVVEVLDDSKYLDAQLFYHNIPGPMIGAAPLWFLAGGSVWVMDGLKNIGQRSIDGAGNLIPQSGDDFSSLTLAVGFNWSALLEPFVPNAQPGQDEGQRMKRRRTSNLAVTTQRSTGYRMVRYYSGPVGPLLPATGTIMGSNRVPAYGPNDDTSLPPPQLEITSRWRPLGRAFDPRYGIIKDTPGTLDILEVGMEVNV